jgi:hypothetical protein
MNNRRMYETTTTTNPHKRTTQKWMNDMSIDQTFIDVTKM